ncbi:hypothetical protein NQZ68_039157 [Dissostichus eleginoides]|nr:hypothetical protein NQZ68_039157 [Dissostichus eleginoides]
MWCCASSGAPAGRLRGFTQLKNGKAKISAAGLERVMRAKIKRHLKCGPSTHKGFLSARMDSLPLSQPAHLCHRGALRRREVTGLLKDAPLGTRRVERLPLCLSHWDQDSPSPPPF